MGSRVALRHSFAVETTEANLCLEGVAMNLSKAGYLRYRTHVTPIFATGNASRIYPTYSHHESRDVSGIKDSRAPFQVPARNQPGNIETDRTCTGVLNTVICSKIFTMPTMPTLLISGEAFLETPL